jgi:hypothetical protein
MSKNWLSKLFGKNKIEPATDKKVETSEPVECVSPEEKMRALASAFKRRYRSYPLLNEDDSILFDRERFVKDCVSFGFFDEEKFRSFLTYINDDLRRQSINQCIIRAKEKKFAALLDVEIPQK